jgi:hypothetical protein
METYLGIDLAKQDELQQAGIGSQISSWLIGTVLCDWEYLPLLSL